MFVLSPTGFREIFWINICLFHVKRIGDTLLLGKVLLLSGFQLLGNYSLVSCVLSCLGLFCCFLPLLLFPTHTSPIRHDDWLLRIGDYFNRYVFIQVLLDKYNFIVCINHIRIDEVTQTTLLEVQIDVKICLLFVCGLVSYSGCDCIKLMVLGHRKLNNFHPRPFPFLAPD